MKKIVGIILTLAVVCSMLMLSTVTAYAASDPITVTINTNQYKSSYTSGDITITATDAGDEAGAYINNQNYLTITATDCLISKVELTVGYYSANSHTINASCGTLSGNTAGSWSITSTDVNASSISYNSTGNLQISAVKVYYNYDISSCTVSGIGDQYYTGKQITPIPTVTFGQKTLQKDVDYTLEYGSNTTTAEGGTVIIKGMGNYVGSKEVTFNIKNPPTVPGTGDSFPVSLLLTALLAVAGTAAFITRRRKHA